MKTIILFTVILLTLSCEDSKQTDIQKEIEDTYKAQVVKEEVEKEGGKKSIKITASNSPMLDTLHPNVTTTNIAVMAYKELMVSEDKEIDEIDVDLYDTNGQILSSYTFPVEALEIIYEKSKIFHNLSEHMASKKFVLVDRAKNNEIIKESVIGFLKGKINSLEDSYGKLGGYQSFGIAEAKSGEAIAYQFQGYLIFEKRNVPYFFYMDPAEGNDKWFGFKIAE